ncbi:hypothetical protein ACHAXS_002486, partial [Conticribra weissflogii]
MMAPKQPPQHPLQPLQYTVLYYKRTNKVHKNRGTSRIDGTLTIHPPPSCVVCLKCEANEDDGGCGNDFGADDENASDEDEDAKDGGNGIKKCGSKKKMTKMQKFQNRKKSAAAGTIKMKSGVIWSGVNNSLAYRAFSAEGLGDGEDLVLNAQWECQIMGALNINNGDAGGGGVVRSNCKIGGDASGTMSAGRRLIGGSSSMRNPAMGSSSLKNSGRSSLGSRTISRAPLVPPTRKLGLVNRNNSNNNTLSLSQPSGKKKRPLLSSSLVATTYVSASSSVTGGKMKKDTNGEWYLDKPRTSDGEESEEDRPVLTSNIPPSLVRNSNMAAKRSRLVVSRVATGPNAPNRGKSFNAKSNNFISASNTSENSNIDNEFPGALGDKLQIPASIRQALRPHQREGIAFLWNCVTGVSPGLREAYATSLELSGAVSSSSDDSLATLDTRKEDEEEDFFGFGDSDRDDGAVKEGVREKML